MKKLALIIFGLLLLASPALATNRYVVNTGGSGSTCSSGSPCTLSTGQGLTGAGDTLIFKCASGTSCTYTEGLNFSGLTAGSFATATTIKPDTGLTVTFQPPIGSGGGGVVGLIISASSYFIVQGDPDGDRIQNLIFDCRHVGGDTCVSLRSTPDHIRISGSDIGNCDLDNAPFDGAASQNRSGITGGGTGSEFLYNKIHHCLYGVYTSGLNMIIKGNEFYNNWAEGIHRACFQCYTGSTIISDNLTYNNGQSGHQNVSGLKVGTGISAYYGDDQPTYIYNNIAWNNWSAGIFVAEGSFNGSNPQVFVYNNTVIANDVGDPSEGAGGNYPNGIYAKSTGLQTTVKNNISCNNGNTQIVNNTTGGSTSDNTTSCSQSEFVNYASNNYHPSSSASWRDIGLVLTSVFTTDRDGVTRGSSWDRGAYEFTTPGSGLPTRSIFQSTVMRCEGCQ